MIKLYTEEEFENAKPMDKLPLQCECCGETFYVVKKWLKYCYTNEEHSNRNKYCSNKCYYKTRTTKFLTQCAECGKEIYVKLGEHRKSKSGLHFCSKSCAVKYNNTHKTKGCRRSKLEKYIEEKLSLLYPNIEILYNVKSIINSELDIYIPSLKLAFELNGIFHYEPIFGENKLHKIQNNDENKFKKCIENDISLCVIDTSSFKYFKEQNAIKYLNIITNIINSKICDN